MRKLKLYRRKITYYENINKKCRLQKYRGYISCETRVFAPHLFRIIFFPQFHNLKNIMERF